MAENKTVEVQITELEKRATAAEKTVAAMQKQLAVAASKDGNADTEARLRELLRLLLEDREECEAIRAQRDELKEENERLRLLASKHEYRCKHLLRTIDELEGNNKA